MVSYNTPEPLTAFPYIRTNDPDAWMHAITSLFLSSKSEIKASKNFDAFVNVARLGSTILIGMGCSARFSHLYTPETNDLLVNLLLDGKILVRLKNNELYYKRGGMRIVHQKDIPAYIYEESVRSIHVLFQIDAITNFMDAVYGGKKISFDTNKIFGSAENNSYFKKVLLETVKTVEAFPEIINQPMIASQYEQLLLLSFLAPSSQNPDVRTSPAPSSVRAVRLVEEYIEANMDKPVRLQDLAAVTGQSVRTIQESFKKHRGYSPSSFLRECRLIKARKLLQECPPGASIVSVALDCGFASHGHFSYCYKKRFGENPKTTLQHSPSP